MVDEEQPREVIVERDKKSYTGVIVGVIAVILLILAVLYGLPYLTGTNNGANEVEVTPAPTTSPTTP